MEPHDYFWHDHCVLGHGQEAVVGSSRLRAGRMAERYRQHHVDRQKYRDGSPHRRMANLATSLRWRGNSQRNPLRPCVPTWHQSDSPVVAAIPSL